MADNSDNGSDAAIDNLTAAGSFVKSISQIPQTVNSFVDNVNNGIIGGEYLPKIISPDLLRYSRLFAPAGIILDSIEEWNEVFESQTPIIDAVGGFSKMFVGNLVGLGGEIVVLGVSGAAVAAGGGPTPAGIVFGGATFLAGSVSVAEIAEFSGQLAEDAVETVAHALFGDQSAATGQYIVFGKNEFVEVFSGDNSYFGQVADNLESWRDVVTYGETEEGYFYPELATGNGNAVSYTHLRAHET